MSLQVVTCWEVKGLASETSLRLAGYICTVHPILTLNWVIMYIIQPPPRNKCVCVWGGGEGAARVMWPHPHHAQARDDVFLFNSVRHVPHTSEQDLGNYSGKRSVRVVYNLKLMQWKRNEHTLNNRTGVSQWSQDPCWPRPLILRWGLYNVHDPNWVTPTILLKISLPGLFLEARLGGFLYAACRNWNKLWITASISP